MTLNRIVSLGGGPVDLIGNFVPTTGGRPGAANTGPLGVYNTVLGRRLSYADLTPSTGLTVTTPGAVIDGLDITGALTIRADNVTVQNSRVRAVKNTGVYAVAWGNVAATNLPPTGLRLVDVEIDGNGTDGADVGPYPSGWAQSAAVQPGIGYELLRCDIHSLTDGIKPQDNPTGSAILIDRCWVHDLTSYYITAANITHNDILQIAGSGAHDVTIRQNFLDGYRAGDPNFASRYASSSLMQWGSFPGSTGVLANILIEDNWIDGGGYASRLNAVGVAVCQNVLIRNNRFGLRHRFGALTGVTVSTDGGQIIATGNVWDEAGTTDAGLTVAAGQPLA